MKENSGPIGVFDSGFGGLTVFRRIEELLPQYDYIYLGDTARTPYGNRSFDAVLRFTTAAVDFLFRQGCPLIIIACNTASAKALRNIQQLYLPKHFPDRRVLGVIRPTVEAIAALGVGTVALWATEGTVRSQSFAIEIEKYAPGVTLVQQACPLLVPLIEAGETEGEGLGYFIEKYWRATREQAADIGALLLACTHYPLIIEAIRHRVPPTVRMVSQDVLIAPSLKNYLERHPEMEHRLSRGGGRRFLTTDVSTHFERLAGAFLGRSISAERAELDC